ncbi:hypothetical protein BaRGS_00011132 [Batillaria attramentaria]|uniref:Uncharacterized protein n=1 Tax=Batillaria attramentaria TaxID=370345 RepID=A0ABD0LEJ3_9CAEN
MEKLQITVPQGSDAGSGRSGTRQIIRENSAKSNGSGGTVWAVIHVCWRNVSQREARQKGEFRGQDVRTEREGKHAANQNSAKTKTDTGVYYVTIDKVLLVNFRLRASVNVPMRVQSTQTQQLGKVAVARIHVHLSDLSPHLTTRITDSAWLHVRMGSIRDANAASRMQCLFQTQRDPSLPGCLQAF